MNAKELIQHHVSMAKANSIIACSSIAMLTTNVHATTTANNDANSIDDVMENPYIQQMFGKLAPIMRFVLYTVEALAVLYFVFTAAFNGMMYFKKHDTPQEANQFKKNFQQACLGAFVALIISFAIDLALSLFGITFFHTTN